MDVDERAAVHRALGDPARLAIVDALGLGERSPSELLTLLGVSSNLLAHHVAALERTGIVRRTRSAGDRRRTYLGLVPGALDSLVPAPVRDAARVVFVCTENSARSQLAAGLWNGASVVSATSAGTRPAAAVHPGAVKAAHRHAVALPSTVPRHVADVLHATDVIITVCDTAHEELAPRTGQQVHWSVTDPARAGDAAAFDRAVVDLRERISRVAPRFRAAREGPMSAPTSTDDLSIDQQLALRTAAVRLSERFREQFGTETIERFLMTSYDQFAARATVANYLPLLAERFAKQRLTALAKVEGKTQGAVPVVLFLCTHNAGRSQMALGFVQHLAGDRVVAWSGGSEPGDEMNPAAVAAMAERDIDIAAEYPKPWTEEIVRAADVVVTMGCGDACPVHPGRRYEDWALDDPTGLAVEDVRPIRDEVERRVRRLLEELGVAVDA